MSLWHTKFLIGYDYVETFKMKQKGLSFLIQKRNNL